jgi:5-methylcytosine-specific restriction endonuclease McrA
MREYSREKRAAWRDANRERMAESNREYRRANADKVRAKNLRRRARLLNAFDEDVDLTELFARDGGLCGICREPVDPAIPWPDKRSKTLDHIVPLSRGGRHSWANAQLAHAVCNSRKNDHLLPA